MIVDIAMNDHQPEPVTLAEVLDSAVDVFWVQEVVPESAESRLLAG